MIIDIVNLESHKANFLPLRHACDKRNKHNYLGKDYSWQMIYPEVTTCLDSLNLFTSQSACARSGNTNSFGKGASRPHFVKAGRTLTNKDTAETLIFLSHYYEEDLNSHPPPPRFVLFF